MRRAIYPGSFDPTTNGHLDLIARAVKMFDEVVVAVAPNSLKSPLFSVEERMAMLTAHTTQYSTVRVSYLDGLLVDYAKSQGAVAIVRGLRAVSDFEFEFQMALMNQRLNPRIETVFMMPAEQYTYISSRLIKEVFSLGERVHGLVPELVEERLRAKVLATKGA